MKQPNQQSNVKYPLFASQPGVDAIRNSLLVWQNRNIPLDLTLKVIHHKNISRESSRKELIKRDEDELGDRLDVRDYIRPGFTRTTKRRGSRGTAITK
jgi:hypothetical protein